MNDQPPQLALMLQCRVRVAIERRWLSFGGSPDIRRKHWRENFVAWRAWSRYKSLESKP